MKFTIATLVAFTALLFLPPSHAQARNFQQVICDDEPDPDTCAKIQLWYKSAKMPTSGTYGSYPSSCCGEADAYWADQIDRVTDKGVFVTITDKRNCATTPQYQDDEEGNYYQTPSSPTDECIRNRVERDGQKIFIPNNKLDDRHQGNPTGHNVVFLGVGTTAYEVQNPAPGTGGLWPTVYCAFLGFAG